MSIAYEKLIAEASKYVPDDVRLDMCRHESVTEEVFWLFRNEKQIGVVAHEPGYAFAWRGTRMYRGMPTGQLRFGFIDEALRYACS